MSVEQGIQQLATPWFRSLLREDPSEHLRRIRVPTLALFGELDRQVASHVNAAIVARALREAGNDRARVRVLSGLNHLFQHAETGAMDEYGRMEETIAPEVLEGIADWIGEGFGGKR